MEWGNLKANVLGPVSLRIQILYLVVMHWTVSFKAAIEASLEKHSPFVQISGAENAKTNAIKKIWV